MSVEVHADHFVHDEIDQRWLEECGRRGWVVLTKDRNIRYNLVERRALLNAGVAAFVLTSGNMSGADMASAFVKALPRIARFLRKYTPPYIAKVHKDGKVEAWINAQGEVVGKSKGE